MPEKAFMYLMPASAMVFWGLLMARGVESALYCAGFYWLWALKNWLVGPLKGDAGILTFALYAASVLLGWSALARVASALVLATNYGGLWVGLMFTPAQKVARKLRKSDKWVVVFKAYLAVSAMYWCAVAGKHWSSGGAVA
jgi:hypothetical protein